VRSPTGWPRAAVLTQNREVPRDPMVIRRAGPEESASIQAIEVAAGLQFAEVGLARVAEDPPMALDRIEQQPCNVNVGIGHRAQQDRRAVPGP